MVIAIGMFRILAATSLSCAHTWRHEIRTSVNSCSQPETSAARRPPAKLGRFFERPRLALCPQHGL